MVDDAAPQEHAHRCPRCGQSHPGAGCGGVVPPPEHRWQPGESANPGGRLKGSFSARAYGRSKWAKEPDEESGVGAGARRAWDELERCASIGDLDGVRAWSIAIEQIEGKPVEYVERTDNRVRTVVVKDAPAVDPQMP